MTNYPLPWQAVADEFAYEVRVHDARGRTVMVLPIRVLVDAGTRRRVLLTGEALALARGVCREAGRVVGEG